MTVYRILQGQDGRIWIGTDQGLSRFNGFQFRNYGPAQGMPGSEVIHMVLDDHDRVWVGTFSGKLAYLEKGQFKDREQASWIPELEGVPMTLAQLESGEMVVGTNYSVWLFGEEKLPELVTKNGLGKYRLAFDQGAEPMTLLHYNGLQYPIRKDDQLPGLGDSLQGLPNGWVAFFYQNRSSLVTRSKLDRIVSDSVFIRMAKSSLMEECVDCKVVTMEWDLHDNLWMGTKNHGLYTLRRSDGSLVKALKDGEIITLFNDREGNMWVGTNGSGLYMFRENDLNAYHLDQSAGLLENHVISLGMEGEGTMVLGYLSGKLSRMNLGNLRHTPLPLPIYYNRKLKFVHQLESEETLLGVESGSLIFPKGEWQGGEVENLSRKISDDPDTYVTPLPNSPDFAIHFLDFGSIKNLAVVSDSLWYIATSNDVMRCIRTTAGIECRECLGKRAEALAYDRPRNRIWVSVLDSLLFLENGIRVGGKSLKTMGNRISYISPDGNGGFWLGSPDRGVFLMRDGEVSHFDQSSGLPSNNCTALFVNAKGDALVGTDKGLVSVSFPEGKKGDPDFIYHDKRTGLADNHVLDIIQNHDTIWLATRKGLSFWVPGEETGRDVAPVLETESIAVNGRDTLVQGNYELAYWQNSFSIHFFDPSYRADAFQFRCLGLDTNWSDLATPAVEMPFLAPGRTYEVQVRARSAFKSWGAPTTISFHIREAFFQSTLFFFLLGSGLLGAIGAVFAVRQRNRYRLLREREQFQQQIAQLRLTALKARMNPHFIFNSLNAIQHLVVEGKDRNTFDFISSFSKLIRMILDNSDRDFIPLKEEIELCRLYLEVESRRLNEDFKYVLNVDPDLEMNRIYIPTMIIQPFLENAIWHGLMPKADDRSLFLAFQTLEKGFQVVVEDNGIGRKAAEELKNNNRDAFQSQSTKIFDQRITLLNKSFNAAPFRAEYEDLLGANGEPFGTRLTLTFPQVQNPIQF